MKNIFACIVLVGMLLNVGCFGSETKQNFDDVYSTEYLKAVEGKKLVYPEGVEPPEHLLTYDIPSLPPDSVVQKYDINELVGPPDMIGDKINKEEEKNKTASNVVIGETLEIIYIGVGFGSMDFKGHYEGISYGDAPVASNVYASLRLNNYFAGEFVYKQSNDIESGEIPGSGFDRLSISSEFEAVVARLRGSISLSKWFNWLNDFSIFGTAGFFDSEVRIKGVELNSLETGVVSGSDSGLALGGGLLYRVGKMNLRAYFESLDVNDIDKADDMGISIEFGF